MRIVFLSGTTYYCSMISVEEASHLIQSYREYPGRTKQGLRADRDYPPFHRVMMDGIAVSFEAYEKGLREFSVVGVCPAGETAKKLERTQDCFEVMTGAPLPLGADLVIQYEHVKLEAGNAKVIVEIPRTRFDSVHLEGSDCCQGHEVLPAGAEFNGPHAGIAASFGYADVEKIPSPKILLISTGDELVEVHQTPLPHQIRRSNVYALKTSLELNGYGDVTLAHLNDETQTVAHHYQENAARFDWMIYSGGVSKGKFDYLPNVWADMGVKKVFHGIAQRPGKPMWFGVDEKKKTKVVGLPGNPVSSLVCLHRYLISGREMYARLTEEVVFKKDLTYFLPVKVSFSEEGILNAAPLKIKNSGEFSALAGSDGFLELPANLSVFKAQESFKFFPWRHF